MILQADVSDGPEGETSDEAERRPSRPRRIKRTVALLFSSGYLFVAYVYHCLVYLFGC